MISENLFYIKSIRDSEKVHTSRFQFMFWKYFAEKWEDYWYRSNCECQ